MYFNSRLNNKIQLFNFNLFKYKITCQSCMLCFSPTDGEKADISADTYADINIIAGALKLYLRDLPIPVITFDLYSKFIQAASKSSSGLRHALPLLRQRCAASWCSSRYLAEIPNAESRLEAIHEGLLQLPPAHYETLRYLMAHLKRLVYRRKSSSWGKAKFNIPCNPTGKACHCSNNWLQLLYFAWFCSP